MYKWLFFSEKKGNNKLIIFVLFLGFFIMVLIIWSIGVILFLLVIYKLYEKYGYKYIKLLVRIYLLLFWFVFMKRI